MRHTKRGAEVVQRSAPVQARSIATVARILDTAAVLLDEVGVDGFTTNLLAARSGERVRTIYRYYPNKHAVVAAVAERLAAAESAHVLGFAAVADPALAPREVIDRVLHGYLEGARAQPGFAAIRKAMRAVPALMAIERAANDALVLELARALGARGLGPPARLTAIAVVVVESVAAVLDRALSSTPAASKRLLAELATMLERYLTEPVSAETAARSAARRVRSPRA